jgi:hypothetical protein
MSCSSIDDEDNIQRKLHYSTLKKAYVRQSLYDAIDTTNRVKLNKENLRIPIAGVNIDYRRIGRIGMIVAVSHRNVRLENTTPLSEAGFLRTLARTTGTTVVLSTTVIIWYCTVLLTVSLRFVSLVGLHAEERRIALRYTLSLYIFSSEHTPNTHTNNNTNKQRTSIKG